MRFCSYCYAESDELSKCGKCKKRLYCSRECQAKDWKSGKVGGAHKLYCGISGEINIDYEIRNTGRSDVGDGIFALRDFGKNEVIIVERPIITVAQRALNPLIPDVPESAKHMVDALMPKNGTFKEKIDRNGISCTDECVVDGLTGLFLTLSKANHCCLGNSDHQYFDHRRVKILVSSKPIAKGEEITFSYVSSLKWNERKLKLAGYPYLFQCKCVACTSQSVEEKLAKVWKLDDEILRLGGQGKVEMALRKGELLLNLYEELGLSMWLYQRTYYDLFQVCITKQKFLSQGRRYIGMAHQALVAFSKDDQHPEAVRFDDLMKNPHIHRNYLLLER